MCGISMILRKDRSPAAREDIAQMCSALSHRGPDGAGYALLDSGTLAGYPRVYEIATIPSARRRGYGAAMTARVVLDASAAGCDVAALQASASGRPIYERVGFRVDVLYVSYLLG